MKERDLLEKIPRTRSKNKRKNVADSQSGSDEDSLLGTLDNMRKENARLRESFQAYEQSVNTMSERVKELEAENDQLKKENLDLQERLAEEQQKNKETQDKEEDGGNDDNHDDNNEAGEKEQGERDTETQEQHEDSRRELETDVHNDLMGDNDNENNQESDMVDGSNDVVGKEIGYDDFQKTPKRTVSHKRNTPKKLSNTTLKVKKTEKVKKPLKGKKQSEVRKEGIEVEISFLPSPQRTNDFRMDIALSPLHHKCSASLITFWSFCDISTIAWQSENGNLQVIAPCIRDLLWNGSTDAQVINWYVWYLHKLSNGRTLKTSLFLSALAFDAFDKGKEEISIFLIDNEVRKCKFNKDVSFVFVPIYSGEHWSLLVFDVLAPEWSHYDSLSIKRGQACTRHGSKKDEKQANGDNK